MPKVNKTRYAVLGVLSIMPASGYDIKKFCSSSITHFWNENFGQIYPVLRDLEQEGLVTRIVEHTSGKPDRNVYSITPDGMDALTAWLMQPAEPTPTRMELLLKLLFGANVPVGNIIEKLEQTRARHLANLDEYRQTEAAYERSQKAKSQSGYPYWMAALRYGIGSAEFTIKWCEETIGDLKGHYVTGI